MTLGLFAAAIYFVPVTFWVLLGLSIAGVVAFVLTRLPYRARRT